MNETDSGRAVLYVIIGILVLVFWVSWYFKTADIRDDIRKWREEEKERHEEIVDLLRKEKTPE